MKRVYVGVVAEVLHPGIVNLIFKASQYGRVTVGLLTDKAIMGYRPLPTMSWDERRIVIEQLKGVECVIPQNEWSYVPNLNKVKPEYFVHGDDWKFNSNSVLRNDVLDCLDALGAELIEIPYTERINEKASIPKSIYRTPEIRRRSLQRMLDAGTFCRIIESHSAVSALAVDNVRIKENPMLEFDGFWSSSLADSLIRGKPDNEFVPISSRLSVVEDIFSVSRKPLIFDADTGGKKEHFELLVRDMERIGISAVIIEDKQGLKQNSLFTDTSEQQMADVEDFCEKISAANSALLSDDFLIIARIESLILGKGESDALLRADKYVDAGARGIMIHSKSKLPNEVFSFAEKFKNRHEGIPLVAVPSTYAVVDEAELESHGFNICIYANQLLRASYPAMSRVAEQILLDKSAKNIDSSLMQIEDILKLLKK